MKYYKNMKAEEYKKNGYTHVLVELTNFEIKPIITKGFLNYKRMKKYQSEMSLNEINSMIFEFMTVDKAIKKGY